MVVVGLNLVINRTLLGLLILELLDKRTVFITALKLAGSKNRINFLSLLDCRTKESFY